MAEDDSNELESDLIKRIEKIKTRLSDIFFNLADDLAERNEKSAVNDGSIELTPVDSSQLSEESSLIKEGSKNDNSIQEIEKRIQKKFNDLDESFMYLGILKNLSLPDAMKLFEEKFEIIIGFFENVCKYQEYPTRKRLFIELGEDYENIEKLNHANDALDPIYDGLKQVYEDLEQLRDAGLSLEEGKEKMKTINENKK